MERLPLCFIQCSNKWDMALHLVCKQRLLWVESLEHLRCNLLMEEVLVILLPLDTTLIRHHLLHLEERPEGIQAQDHLALGGLEISDQDSKEEVSFLTHLKV